MTKLPIRVNAFVYQITDAGVEFLCIKRVPDDGGFWQTVTGTVHDDESLIGTITREIKEECGIDSENILKIEGPFYDFEWMKGESKIREFVYAVEVKNHATLQVNTWWKQCVASAAESGRIPVLMYKVERKGWKVVMCLNPAVYDVAEFQHYIRKEPIRCTIELEDFREIFRAHAINFIQHTGQHT